MPDVVPIISEGHAREEMSGGPLDQHHLVSLQLRAFDADVSIDGRGTLAGRGPAGACQILRMGERARVTTNVDWRILHLHIADRGLKALVESEGLSAVGLELVDPECGYDRTIEAIGSAIVAELTGGLPFARLQLDTIGVQLSIHLLRHHSNLTPRPGRDGERLAPWQLRRAMECMTDRLSDDLSLAEIAAACGLSPFHFARAFKGSVGEPPHRYQVRLRMERSKKLLRETDESMTGIARAVGYQSSQALARVFRQLTGQSPQQYRRTIQS